MMTRCGLISLLLFIGVQASTITNPLQDVTESSGLSQPTGLGKQNEVAWGYFNADTLLDFIVVPWDPYYVSRIYTQNLDGTFTNTTSLPSSSNQPARQFSACGSVAAADVNKDGISDIIIVRFTATQIYISRVNSDGSVSFTLNYTGPAVLSAAPGRVYWLDANEDGLLDGAYLGAQESRFYINNGSSASPSFILKKDFLSASNNGGTSTLRGDFGDINNDGHLDVVAVAFQNYFCQINVNATVPLFNETGSVSLPSKPKHYNVDVVLGDLDNDGDLDLFLGGVVDPYNPPQYLLNNGAVTPVFTEIPFPLSPEPQGNFNAAQTRYIRLVDFDQDSRLDIYYCDPSSLYHNLGNNTWEFTNQTYSGTLGGCAWADYNGDGYPDLLTADNGQLRLYRNTLFVPKTTSEAQTTFISTEVETSTVEATNTSPFGLHDSTVLAIDGGRPNILYILDPDRPSVIISSTTVSGLQDGEQLLAIAQNRKTSLVWGLTDKNRLYEMDPFTAQVYYQRTLSCDVVYSNPTLHMSFQPETQQLYVLSLLAEPYNQFVIDTQTGACTSSDTLTVSKRRETLNPAGSAFHPASLNTYYVINGLPSNDLLVSYNGTTNLTRVGPLGLDLSGVGGFDIVADDPAYGFAALYNETSLKSGIYRVRLSDGNTVQIGDSNTNLLSFAAVKVITMFQIQGYIYISNNAINVSPSSTTMIQTTSNNLIVTPTSDGLSKGAVAGIVLGVVFGVAIIAAIIALLVWKGKTADRRNAAEMDNIGGSKY